MEQTPERREKKPMAGSILGDPQTHSLENRIFSAVGIISTFAGILATMLNYFSGSPARELALSLSGTFVPLLCYVASRCYQRDRYLRLPMFMFFLVLLSIAWVTNQGSHGSTFPYVLVLFVAGVIILPSPFKRFLIGISFLVVIGLLLLERFRPEIILPYANASSMFFDKAMSLMICLLAITLLVHFIFKEYQKERARSEKLYQEMMTDKEALERALAEIKILKGILPVCSFCKKIRDGNDVWHSLETYISTHSEAVFSHGFCPECGRKHYPTYCSPHEPDRKPGAGSEME